MNRAFTPEAAQQVLQFTGQAQGVALADAPGGCHPVHLTFDNDKLEYLSLNPLQRGRECVIRVKPHELPPTLCGLSFVIGCLMVEQNIFFPSLAFSAEIERAIAINPKLRGFDGLLQFYRDDALTYFQEQPTGAQAPF